MSDHQNVNAPATTSRRLGRGLSALLGGGAPANREADSTENHGELKRIPIGTISRNPFQPRKNFDTESLGELASSIKEHGVIQPIIVRELDGGFQLIAGERRWQAAQKAGLTEIPCRVMDVIDKTACEFAIEENLKRKDLNDLEKAQAFRDYLDQFQCTIEELGKQVSMSRSAVSNMLRLLELPDPIKNALHGEKISAGHARTLLSLDEADQLAMCGRVQAEKMSVRQTEAAVKAILRPETVKPAEPEPSPETAEGNTNQNGSVSSETDENSNSGQPSLFGNDTDGQSGSDGIDQPGEANTIPITAGQQDPNRTAHIESLEAQLRDLLGVKVQIKLRGKDNGFIVVPFQSNDEFERIVGTVRRNVA